MPKMLGPDTPLRSLDSDPTPLVVKAATLGEAMAAYERAFDVSFEAYDGRYPKLPFDPADPKWFIYKSKQPKWEEVAVDIHVERDGEIICPRQNLLFALLPDDTISIGPLAC